MNASSQLIPRSFHWIWLGAKPLPQQFEQWMDGWGALHPGWQKRLWTDANLPHLRNRACFEAASSMAQRADIARYEIIERFGGVYVDTDFECLRNLEPLLRGVSAFVGEEEPGTVNIGIFGAVPNHPWLAAAIRRLPESFAKEQSIVGQTGPDFITRVTRDFPDVNVLPPQIFYPYTWREPHKSAGPFPNSYAVHHWAHSWGGESNSPDARRRLSHALEQIIPPAEPFLTASRQLPVDLEGDRLATPLVRISPLDWGLPADDDQAIDAVANAAAQGFRYLVFDDDSTWWLETYPRLRDFLVAASEEVQHVEHVVVFHLQKRAP